MGRPLASDSPPVPPHPSPDRVAVSDRRLHPWSLPTCVTGFGGDGREPIPGNVDADTLQRIAYPFPSPAAPAEPSKPTPNPHRGFPRLGISTPPC